MTLSIEFSGQDFWNSKQYGVVLVEKEKDIEPLWRLLVEQDEYWENYRHLIQVAPNKITSFSELRAMCNYVGKTDIYEVWKLKEKIPFVLMQYLGDQAPLETPA